MVRVDEGSYRVGCTFKKKDDCFDDEKPAKKVTVSTAYYLMKHEVTIREYGACVRKAACAEPTKSCAKGIVLAEKMPVVCVPWSEAEKYCAFRGWRLPTEEEWEVAARGPKEPHYPWGNEQPNCELGVFANAKGQGCGSKRPLNVGSRPKDKSWVGALDMGGNVREWTSTQYAAYPNGSIEPGDKGKVNRGGSFVMNGKEANTSHTRVVDVPTEARPDLGFRCAWSPLP